MPILLSELHFSHFVDFPLLFGQFENEFKVKEVRKNIDGGVLLRKRKELISVLESNRARNCG